MPASEIGLLVTSLLSVIAAVAAGFNTVRKNQIDTLRETIADLKARIDQLEAGLLDERKAHAVERTAHASERKAHEETRRELLKVYAAFQKAAFRRSPSVS